MCSRDSARFCRRAQKRISECTREYLLQLFPLPDPFGRVIQALIIIVGVLVVIGLLLDLGGYPVGFPRLRGYP